MIDFILRAKHWQVFTYFILIPFSVALINAIISFFLAFINTETIVATILLGIITDIMLYSILIWFWAIGRGLQQFIPENIYQNHKLFKLAFLFLIISLLLSICLNIIDVVGFDRNSMAIVEIVFNSFNFISGTLNLIFSIYLCAFISRGIAIAEKQSDSTLIEHLGTFLLCIFLPIGIWFIQPRINKLVSEDDE